MRAAGLLSGALREAASVLLPVGCAACGAPGLSLCGRCGRRLRASVRIESSTAIVPGVPVVTAAVYEGVPASLVRALKLRGRVDAAGPLAGLLRLALLGALRSCPVVPGAASRRLLLVPAPSRAGAERERGMRHLAETCARAVPGAAAVRALHFTRRVSDQHGLGLAGRHRNLAGSMRAGRAVSGRAVIVVDDVVTSGATAREAVRALRAAGARPLAIAAMTRAAHQ